MEAIKRRVRIKEDGSIEWVGGPPYLPAGEAEVILLYEEEDDERRADERLRATEWPALDGGRYRGGTLGREELYGDEGR